VVGKLKLYVPAIACDLILIIPDVDPDKPTYPPTFKLSCVAIPPTIVIAPVVFVVLEVELL
jgi:hypothetical protein